MMFETSKKINFIIKKYLSVEYLSYNFLIYNCSIEIFTNIFSEFLKDYFDNDNFDDADYLVFNKENKFSRESIDVINEFRQNTSSNSGYAYRFIAIYDIDLVDQLYLNILLKIIEESNNRIVFFLIASNGFNILKTLKSRCFLVDFSFFQNEISIVNHNTKNFNAEEIFDLINLSDDRVMNIFDYICEYYSIYIHSMINICSTQGNNSQHIEKLELLLQNLSDFEKDPTESKLKTYFCDCKSFLLDLLLYK